MFLHNHSIHLVFPQQTFNGGTESHLGFWNDMRVNKLQFSLGSKAVPGLNNINWHGGSGGDQSTDHTGTEMTQNIISEISCTNRSREIF